MKRALEATSKAAAMHDSEFWVLRSDIGMRKWLIDFDEANIRFR